MARDVNLLFPKLRKLALQLVQECKRQGILITISETWRTEAEQNEKYAQGRSKPGPIITKARYPQSLHCWGVAFDVVPLKDVDGDGDLEAFYASPQWRQVGEIGEKLGLEWGGNWTTILDKPHFELPEFSWSGLVRLYGSPENFKKTWKEEEEVSVPKWASDAVANCLKLGIITDEHDPMAPATKGFVLAVVINVLKYLGKWKG